MTEREIREAVVAAIADGRKSIEEGVVSRLIHKPEVPPKGAICEVWDGDGNDEFWIRIRVATGDGGFINGGRRLPMYDRTTYDRTTYDHYRVIPTAHDALKRMDTGDEADYGGLTDEQFQGFHFAIDAVRDLIDNAATG